MRLKNEQIFYVKNFVDYLNNRTPLRLSTAVSLKIDKVGQVFLKHVVERGKTCGCVNNKEKFVKDDAIFATTDHKFYESLQSLSRHFEGKARCRKWRLSCFELRLLLAIVMIQFYTLRE